MASSPAKVIPLKPALAKRLGYIGKVPGTQTRASDDWYTPPEYLDAVRAVLNQIDLDPFSSNTANQVVKAQKIFSLEHSAFEHEWSVTPHTRVFMNPPYSAQLIGRATQRFLQQWQQKKITEGIVLVNNATDTRWFQSLAQEAAMLCFTNHRISFWNSDGKKISGNTRGQVFLYFGEHPEVFRQVFSTFGIILTH